MKRLATPPRNSGKSAAESKKPPRRSGWLSGSRLNFLHWSRRPGMLSLLALILALAGGLRFGEGVIALAQTGGASGNEDSVAVPQDGAVAAQAAPSAPENLSPLVEALQERDSQLKRREAALDAREQAMAAAQQQLAARLQELDEAERRLADTLTIADQAADQDVARLVAMYQAMKPKQAAQVFSQMEPAFAAGVLARMEPAGAGALLAEMPPEQAYALSVIVAGRNANAPKK